ncbi:MAG: zinc ribbon domain-containing protein [Phycisphaeraceae bacterium]|nr:zinc ribbon domain-containing protein [Phycisphaeraceae bacterium]
MPTYDYVCDACGHAFEHFQSITADPEKTCPECRKRKLRRLIGMGAAILVGGSGAAPPASESESSNRASSDSETSKTDAASDGGDSTTTSKDDASADPPEKKISGSTSTPTHEAREGRGVGNLVDAARRQRKADQKQKTGGGDAAKPTKPAKTTKKAVTKKKTAASKPKSAKTPTARKKK